MENGIKEYAAPSIKVIALSTSARLCQQASVTIPGMEDGGEWPD